MWEWDKIRKWQSKVLFIMGNCQANQATLEPPHDPRIIHTESTLARKGVCCICLDEEMVRSHLTAENNEHFNLAPCSHMFCQECFQQYVEVSVKSMKSEIACPRPDCTYKLSHNDVRNNTSHEVYQKYVETNSVSHVDRFLENDPKMLEYMGVNKEIEKYKQALKAHKDACKMFQLKQAETEQMRKGVKNERVFGHGTRVRATYLTTNPNSTRYVATVIEVNSDMLSLSYDDGDFWGACPKSCAAFLNHDRAAKQESRAEPLPLSHFLKEFKVGITESGLPLLDEDEIVRGKRVMAGWTSGASMYTGTISSVNRLNRTAAISYDDGDFWDSCPFNRIMDTTTLSIKCCPTCCIIIHKSEGCDSMRCVCGQSFYWNSTPVIPRSLLDKILEKEQEQQEDQEEQDKKLPALMDEDLPPPLVTPPPSDTPPPPSSTPPPLRPPSLRPPFLRTSDTEDLLDSRFDEVEHVDSVSPTSLSHPSPSPPLASPKKKHKVEDSRRPFESWLSGMLMSALNMNQRESEGSDRMVQI